jgi:hypothetical protein
VNQPLHYRLTIKTFTLVAMVGKECDLFASGSGIFYLKKKKEKKNTVQRVTKYCFSAYFTNKIRISVVILIGCTWFGECYI